MLDTIPEMWYNKGTKEERCKKMQVLVIMILVMCVVLGVQALVCKIKSARIQRKMKKESQALEKKIADHLESKKYVTITF